MVAMEVFETSGVDHPAHGHEGWLVTKSAGAGRSARLHNLLKGTTMTPTKEALVKSVNESDAADSVKAFMLKSIDLTDDIAAAAELWQSLRAKQEAGDPETPTVPEAVAPVAAAAAPAPAPAVPDVFKSLGAAEQVELAKAAEENPALLKALNAIGVQAQEALAKAAEERNTRLDTEAIQKSRDSFKHVALDHDSFAPALRKMAETDPKAHAAILEVLEKAEGQLEAASLFQELGHGQRHAVGKGAAMQKATGIAQALVAAGSVKSIAEGVAKAFADDPALYAEHEQEGA
jgi:hypothetical protein